MELDVDPVELLARALPHPDQISDVERHTEDKCVYFTWRRTRYKMSWSHSLSVDEKDGCMLVGNDKALLMRTLLNRKLTHIKLAE